MKFWNHHISSRLWVREFNASFPSEHLGEIYASNSTATFLKKMKFLFTAWNKTIGKKNMRLLWKREKYIIKHSTHETKLKAILTFSRDSEGKGGEKIVSFSRFFNEKCFLAIYTRFNSIFNFNCLFT